jgi:hypothetical protein
MPLSALQSTPIGMKRLYHNASSSVFGSESESHPWRNAPVNPALLNAKEITGISVFSRILARYANPVPLATSLSLASRSSSSTRTIAPLVFAFSDSPHTRHAAWSVGISVQMKKEERTPKQSPSFNVRRGDPSSTAFPNSTNKICTCLYVDRHLP